MTCKTVRHEAIGSFFAANTIIIEMISFDPATDLLVRRKIQSLRSNYNVVIPGAVDVETFGTRSWNNFKGWMRVTHDGRSSITSPTKSSARKVSEPVAKIIAGMLTMVNGMQKTKWEEVELALDLLRFGLIACDHEWSQD